MYSAHKNVQVLLLKCFHFIIRLNKHKFIVFKQQLSYKIKIFKCQNVQLSLQLNYLKIISSSVGANKTLVASRSASLAQLVDKRPASPASALGSGASVRPSRAPRRASVQKGCRSRRSKSPVQKGAKPQASSASQAPSSGSPAATPAATPVASQVAPPAALQLLDGKM